VQPAADWSKIIILSILLLALSVRLLGITYGLPYVFYTDESLLVNHAMAFGTGDLNPHDFIYPSLYMYVLYIVYGITYLGGRLLGVFGSTNDFIRLFFTDATMFYLPGRLIAALSGVASVWMVYKVGRRAYNLQVGLISAAILSFSVLHVMQSHYVKTHVPAGLLVITTIWLAWSIYDGQSNWRRYLLAGATAGLAASTVYHAGLALISLVVAHLLYSRRQKDVRLLDPKLIGAAAASFIAFVVTTPFAILDWSTFFSDLTATGTLYHAGGLWERGPFYPFTSLLSSFGQPVGIIALLGIGYALLRHRPADCILASQPIFLGLFLMLFRVHFPTDMLIAFPAISILAASFVADTVKSLCRGRNGIEKLTAATVTGLLVIGPALTSFRSSYQLSLPDTRIQAKAWVEENIPPGSKILMNSGKYYLSAYGPPVTLSRWTLEQLINRGSASSSSPALSKRDGTRRVAFPGESAFFQYQLSVLGKRPGYDIYQILDDIASAQIHWLSLQQYLDQGVQYAIISSAASESYFKHKDFYESVSARGILIKHFRPSEKIGGPELLIYRLP
jgi:hypothetical protein